MKYDIQLPEAISSRIEYKRKYGLMEMYRAFVLVPGAIVNMISNRRGNLIDEDFIERLQLTVTEVNGCAACSYAHSYMALKKGMSNEEISSFLSGDKKFVKPSEAKAILFAQHYAELKGHPKEESLNSIVNEYGERKASIILSAVQLIFAGNIYGIPYSAFQSRLGGHPYRESTLLYEMGMQVAGLLILPIALAHGILRVLAGFLNRRVENNEPDNK